MTDIRILSCPQCGFPMIRDCGNGLYQCDDCGTYFDKNENILQTNEEWFCSLSVEEKAKFFAGIVNTHPCGYLIECNQCGLSEKCTEDKYPTDAEVWVEWLKQIHTTKE